MNLLAFCINANMTFGWTLNGHHGQARDDLRLAISDRY